MLIDNNSESDPNKIAEGFNSFFSSIVEKLQGNIHTANADFKRYFSDRIDSSFVMQSADIKQLQS